jgi:amidase
MDDALGLWTASRLEQAIRDRSVSSRELLDAYVRRVERLNPSINAVVTLDVQRASEAAHAADEATAAGGSTADGLGPLHGLPITVKDAIETAGIRSTGGATELTDHVPDVDAPAVARLRAAGAVVFGKTNAPRWSGDIQTYNDLFGTTNNPWDLTRTPGGSSGGAAAAVSAGLTSFELGTDIGGSVRIPSHFCGVFGHKPSYGIVSQRGYLDHVGGGVVDADINVFGPIARSAVDLDLLLGVLAGPDREIATAWRLELPPPRHDDLGAYRIGLWLDDPVGKVATDVGDLLSGAADALAGAGAQVETAHPPIPLQQAVQLFTALIMPAVSVSTDRETGERISGSHRAWLDNHRARALMRRVWAEWFLEYDVLLCPVMPMPAFPHDQTLPLAERSVPINGQPRPHMATLAWTGLVGVAYLPSTVVPVGFTPKGLPVGIQVVGPYLEDRTPLFIAAQMAELVGGYVAPPGA